MMAFLCEQNKEGGPQPEYGKYQILPYDFWLGIENWLAEQEKQRYVYV